MTLDRWDVLTLAGALLVLAAAYLLFDWPGVLALGGSALLGLGIMGAKSGR